jgi:hypothetical protein
MIITVEIVTDMSSQGMTGTGIDRRK